MLESSFGRADCFANVMFEPTDFLLQILLPGEYHKKIFPLFYPLEIVTLQTGLHTSNAVTDVNLHKTFLENQFPENDITRIHLRFNRCVPPLCCKTCAVRPVFARVVGKLGTADSRICLEVAMKANARPGAH